MRISTSARTALLVVALAAGCRTAPNYPLPATTWTVPSGIEANPPMEVAVLPVQNLGAEARLPLGTLRESLCAGLIESAYSPIDTRFVDAHSVSASTQGAAGEAVEASYGADLAANERPDAWLRVSLNQSDDQLFPATGAFFLGGRAELLSADGSDVLWGADIMRRLELGATHGLRLGDATFLDQAARLYAAEIVKLLPVRKATLAPKAF